MDLGALVEKASAILDDATEPFLAGHRADSAVQKKGNDFATDVDLAIERQVVAALTETTGIGVHGEEFGGTDLDSEWVWVLDPVDGTFNYAAGSPMAGILLGLLHHGDPVAGLTWLPFLDQRYTAVADGPLMKNGVAQPPLAPVDLADALIGAGSFSADARGGSRGATGSRCGEPQPGLLAVAHARFHRTRPGLRRRRNPRWLNQFRWSRVGRRRRSRAGAGRRWRRHRRPR